jgi:hypothetical protein
LQAARSLREGATIHSHIKATITKLSHSSTMKENWRAEEIPKRLLLSNWI